MFLGTGFNSRLDGGSMRVARSRGFSLIELMVVVVLGTIILGISVQGLKKATTMGGSRGLATAVSAELRLAREQAITKGSPVAVVFRPGVSRSLFTLEGQTEPIVTRVVNYQGDYPDGAIAVATYPGPAFGPAPVVIGSKATAWQQRLDDWLPDEFADHNVIMFTPNGSVVTNDLPAADSSFRVIVGMGMQLSGDSLVAAGEPYTIAVSQSGAVEQEKGLLGSSGGVGTFGGLSPAVTPPPPRSTAPPAEAPQILHAEVTPPPEMLDGNLVHILDKGEYLTLETYAKSRDGKPLYTGWIDTPITKTGDEYRGAFSIPAVGDAPLLERMEFFPVLEVNGTMETDVWRSVWTWTPPYRAESGDRYSLMADVKDSTFEVSTALPPPPPVVVAPPGEIVFESNRTGNWHLFTMWADGKGVRQLTKGAHNHRCASVTADGRTIAYERNGTEVWVMNVDGTGATRVANGRVPTISPLGNVIAYMDVGNDNIHVKRIDSSGGDVETQVDSFATIINGNTGSAPVHNRFSFSPDGRLLYYTANTTVAGRCVASARIQFTGGGITVSAPVYSSPVNNIADTANPAVGGLYTCRNTGRVYYHADRNDPYLGYFEPDPDGHLRGANDVKRVSVGQAEGFPAPSPGGDMVLFNETVGGLAGAHQIFIVPTGGFTGAGTGTRLTDGPSVNLRPVWISQKSGF